MEKKYKKKVYHLRKVLEQKERNIKVLEHNQKQIKYDEGDTVYIMRTIGDDTNLDINVDETLYLKFDRSINMKNRKSTYDTCTKNKVQILKTIHVNDLLTIENCVKKKMANYVIRKGKEYFKCSYNQLVDVIAACIEFYEERIISKKLDDNVKGQSRPTYNFNKNKVLSIKIISSGDCDNDEYEDTET